MGLLVSLAIFGATSLVWFHVMVPNPVQELSVDVRGTQASPATAALALVSAAGCVALSIAGRGIRWVITSVIVFAAVGVVGLTISAVVNPQMATETSVGQSAGVIGSELSAEYTLWPWVTVVLAALLIGIGTWILVSLRTWNVMGHSKYHRSDPALSSGSGVDPDSVRRDGIDAWDALSRGDDPTRS